MDTLKMRSDNELVAAFIAGNNEAFDTLLSRYQDRLYSYIQFYIHNRDLADDLFQETFVKAIVCLRQGGYQESGYFYAWLTRIAHNLLIDHLRAERHDEVQYADDGATLWNDNPQLLDGSRESELVTEQVLKDVKRLVEHLPEEQREMVQLRYYQGLSFKEIAALTGVSINTALGRMRYAILNMRRLAKSHHISLEIL